MSYCRFSSDDFECDLYIYEDVSGGFTTHVAANRVIDDGKKPPLRRFDLTSEEGVREWAAHHESLMAWMRTADR